ncbi:MAG: deoxyribodipyrimidine photo-lyase [Verrucomicrobiota bacterium]
MPNYKTSIHWFRRDLRLSDNAALAAAQESSETLVPLFILSDWKGEHAWTGPGRQAFLCGCLESLSQNIDHVGGSLIIRSGEQIAVLKKLIKETEADAVFFNRDPDPFGKEQESKLRELCREIGIECHGYKDAVLHEGGEVLTGSGNPYKVYTPYSRSWFDVEKPESLKRVSKIDSPTGLHSELVPDPSHWGLKPVSDLLRKPGEKAARERLKSAIEGVLGGYKDHRNDPSADATSHLGADLRYGTLSVRTVFHEAEKARQNAPDRDSRESIHEFQKQLAWREFFMAILSNFPEVLETDFAEQWRGLHWDEPGESFDRWREGRTGFPLVDAGMRQLAETGYMHNRVRMITAMFLTKDLHIYWRHGESHFIQHLLDGEIANNNGGWQWSAGTGADAAPYFRIQNPWTQTERFDPQGDYIRRWVPELEGVSGKAMQKAPSDGKPIADDYVLPMVDHSTERDETLRRFKAHRGES